MQGDRSEREAAFLIGFGMRRLDFHMVELFDVWNADMTFLSAFEHNLDLIERRVFSLALVEERVVVLEMQTLMRGLRLHYGHGYEELKKRKEPFPLTRERAFEFAGRIEFLCSLLAARAGNRLALYRFGYAVASAATMASLAEGEEEGWDDARSVMKGLPAPEQELANEVFEFARANGDHLPPTIGERCARFGRGLARLDSQDRSDDKTGRRIEGGTKPERERLARGLDERDAWIHQQVCDGLPYKEIVNELKEHREWDQIASIQGVRAAAIRYADRNSLPPVPLRRDH